MAPHSSTLAWKIPWTEELGRLQSMGSQRVWQTERLHFHFSLSCIGKGNGNPLHCSCLENPRDGGTWWAAVYGVTQSWTWLKQLSSSSSSNINTFIQTLFTFSLLLNFLFSPFSPSSLSIVLPSGLFLWAHNTEIIIPVTVILSPNTKAQVINTLNFSYTLPFKDWQATIHGVQRLGHDWVTKRELSFLLYTVFLDSAPPFPPNPGKSQYMSWHKQVFLCLLFIPTYCLRLWDFICSP